MVRFRYFKNKNNKNALQAQARYRTSNHTGFFKDTGSATVEAALVLPFFLCSLCTICVIAQFLLSEASIYHATLHTARIDAKQESAFTTSEGTSSSSSASLKKLGGFLKTNVIFRNYLQDTESSSSFVAGGKNGILLHEDSDEDSVTITSQYVLKVPVYFYTSYGLARSLSIHCRKFTGYVTHDSESDSGGADTVYVAQTGSVYHTNLNCYHLTVTITDQDKVQKIMKSSHYKKCEKCMKSGTTPSQIYITKDGSCYHSSLSCSGLKRSVKAVKKSEVSGMRECSECAKHHR